jgi:predicted amidohydrolase YtcJ
MSRVLLVLALLASMSAMTGAAMAGPKPADTVFLHGFIYTVDAKHTVAQAVAIRNGEIVFVGKDAAAQKYIGDGTKVIDLEGRMVLPGFIDSHAHATAALSDLYEVSLWGLGSVSKYVAAIAEFASAHPDLPAIQGTGWSNTVVPGIGPEAKDIDAVVSDRPVAIWSEDHHSLWVNTAALELGGITAATPDPPNGHIERYPDGSPSGTLREAAADLVADKLPDYSVAQYKAGIRHFERDIAGPLGITTVFIPGMTPGSNAVEALERLAADGKLTVRFRAAVWMVPDVPIDEQIAAAEAERAKHTYPTFQIDSVKFFADGVVEGHTAYLEEPYADAAQYAGDPNYRGTPIWDPAALNEASVAAAEAGFKLHYHSIGDAATSEALDAIAAAEEAVGSTDIRPAITHLQLVDPADYQRFVDLGVVAVPQPYWFLHDDYYYNLQVPYLGQPRAEHEYPMKSFFDRGVVVASASDYPVTIPPDPLDGIQTGVMRWFPWYAEPGDVLWPAQRVTVEQMIDSFTINGAFANYLEDTTGSIEVGKSADLIVLDRDILTVPSKQIGKGSVLLTMFQGRTVFRSKGF